MAIVIPKGMRPPDARTTCSVLQQETDSFGTFFDLDMLYYHEARYGRIVATSNPLLCAMAGSMSFRPRSSEDCIAVLTQRFNVPPYKLMKDGRPSVNRKNILEPLLSDPDITEDAREFIKLLCTVSAAMYMLSYLPQYTSLPISASLDYEGHRMVIAHPTWQVLSTSRISASVPSLQNIASDICDVYTAPAGYQMVFSDSGQIEPRITYSAFIPDPTIQKLIVMYNDAYYGLLHYILGADPNTPIEISDDFKAKRKRLKVLALAGNYGSKNLAAIDPELGPLYDEKIVNHPMRRNLEVSVHTAVRGGQDTFYSYFGTPVHPEGTAKYTPGSKAWANHLIRCGINNPVQTTASDLMGFSIAEAKKVLLPGDHIGAYKHDEGMFYVREDHLDELKDKLQQCQAYRVEGWLPIDSDLVVGRKKSPYASDIY